MPPNTLAIFLDTSALRTAGLNHPDVQKILKYSQRGEVNLFVSHVVWQELRTQYLQNIASEVSKLQTIFNQIISRQGASLIVDKLRAPFLDIWSEEEMKTRSHEAMAEFARENRIEIIPLGADHGVRAWNRYFDGRIPFSPSVDREKGRKNIPDSWILEAAIDLKRDFPNLIAICHDDNLAKALEVEPGLRVLRTVEAAIEYIEAGDHDISDSDSAPMTEEAQVEQITVEAALENALGIAASTLRILGTKIIGLIFHFGSISKAQLYSILEGSGYATELTQSVADQLALARVIVDTGHNYIPGDKEAGAQAKPMVEAEVIRLLKGSE